MIVTSLSLMIVVGSRLTMKGNSMKMVLVTAIMDVIPIPMVKFLEKTGMVWVRRDGNPDIHATEKHLCKHSVDIFDVSSFYWEVDL